MLPPVPGYLAPMLFFKQAYKRRHSPWLIALLTLVFLGQPLAVMAAPCQSMSARSMDQSSMSHDMDSMDHSAMDHSSMAMQHAVGQAEVLGAGSGRAPDKCPSKLFRSSPRRTPNVCCAPS